MCILLYVNTFPPQSQLRIIIVLLVSCRGWPHWVCVCLSICCHSCSPHVYNITIPVHALYIHSFICFLPFLVWLCLQVTGWSRGVIPLRGWDGRGASELPFERAEGLLFKKSLQNQWNKKKAWKVCTIMMQILYYTQHLLLQLASVQQQARIRATCWFFLFYRSIDEMLQTVQTCKQKLFLSGLRIKANIMNDEIRNSCQRLLQLVQDEQGAAGTNGNKLDLKGHHLILTNSYSVSSDGELRIPWDFKFTLSS